MLQYIPRIECSGVGSGSRTGLTARARSTTMATARTKAPSATTTTPRPSARSSSMPSRRRPITRTATGLAASRAIAAASRAGRTCSTIARRTRRSRARHSVSGLSPRCFRARAASAAQLWTVSTSVRFLPLYASRFPLPSSTFHFVSLTLSLEQTTGGPGLTTTTAGRHT